MYRESAEAKKLRGQKLRAAVIKSGYKPTEIAEKLGIHKNTLYCWFRDPTVMVIRQVDSLITILKLPESDLKEIFLPAYECIMVKRA